MELGPISARTRKHMAGFKSRPPQTSAAGSNGSAEGEGSGGGPIARQKQKEDKWRQKLQNQDASWWTCANVAIAQEFSSRRQKADSLMETASLAKLQSSSALRTLARGRAHAKAELSSISAWRDSAIDSFVGAPASDTPSVEPGLPPKPDAPSPGHFSRRYSKAKPLPPLKLTTRSKLGSNAAAARDREARTHAARAAAFAVK